MFPGRSRTALAVVSATAGLLLATAHVAKRSTRARTAAAKADTF